MYSRRDFFRTTPLAALALSGCSSRKLDPKSGKNLQDLKLPQNFLGDIKVEEKEGSTITVSNSQTPPTDLIKNLSKVPWWLSVQQIPTSQSAPQGKILVGFEALHFIPRGTTGQTTYLNLTFMVPTKVLGLNTIGADVDFQPYHSVNNNGYLTIEMFGCKDVITGANSGSGGFLGFDSAEVCLGAGLYRDLKAKQNAPRFSIEWTSTFKRNLVEVNYRIEQNATGNPARWQEVGITRELFKFKLPNGKELVVQGGYGFDSNVGHAVEGKFNIGKLEFVLRTSGRGISLGTAIFSR